MSNNKTSENFSKIYKKVDIIDYVRELFHENYNKDFEEIKINIPRIVIIGMQSCGKSSVLENITGITFLIDEGMCTRCIHEIRIRKSKDRESYRIKYSDMGENEWVEVQPDEITTKLKELQDNLFDKNSKNLLSDKVIIVEINKKYVPDLTLIDLPGITYSNEETEKLIKNIIINYIKEINTIVLCGHSATSDFNTNECIKLIKNVNKNYKDSNIFERTIPVITHIDKCSPDKLISIKREIDNYSFKFQPILVRNRSKKEIEEKVPFENIRKNEKAIVSNPILKDYYKTPQGIENLIKCLVEIQNEYLSDSLIKINEKIDEYLEYYQKKLDNIPKGCKNRKEFNEELTKLTSKFKKLIDNKLDNVYIYKISDHYDDFDPRLESKIRNEFQKNKEKLNSKFFVYFTIEYYQILEKIVKDSLGLNLENFYEDDIIYKIIKYNLNEYFSDTYKLIDTIYKLIEDTINEPFDEAFKIYEGTYDNFKKEAKILITDLMMKNLKKCKEMFEHRKEIEMNRVQTTNKNYLDISTRIENEIKKQIKSNNDQNQNRNKDKTDSENESKNESENENESESDSRTEYEIEDETINMRNNENENNINISDNDKNKKFYSRFNNQIKKILSNKSNNKKEIKNKNEKQIHSNDNQNQIINKLKTNSENESDNENENESDNRINSEIEDETINMMNNEDNININDNEYFYFYTGLNKELFNKFISDISKLNNKGKKGIKDKNIRIICSIYSYYKIFLDRFLDNIYGDIIYYLLKPFKNSDEIQFNLFSAFQEMDDKKLISIMSSTKVTKNKQKIIENNIYKLETAKQRLELINQN